LTNTKRLGRYHHSVNNNNDLSSSSYFSEIASLYKENGWRPSLIRNHTLFGHRNSLQKALASANKTIERSTTFLNKIKTKEIACSNRAKSIPENATIRKEYVKCGKQICEQKHGPYYYAYWKDPESKKLKKKYIGNYNPMNEQSNNKYNEKNQIL
jgi:hypothetical protein